MDLKSGYPYWAVKNGLMQAFPRLEAEAACEVAVVGGGITGALIACELAAHGIDALLVGGTFRPDAPLRRSQLLRSLRFLSGGATAGSVAPNAPVCPVA